jgi:hypothetical protein
VSWGELKDMRCVREDVVDYAANHGWHEVRPEDRELVLRSLRRAVLDALYQKVPTDDIFALIGPAVSKYGEAMAAYEKTAESVLESFDMKLSDGPKMVMARHLSDDDRSRHRIFSQGSHRNR